MTCNNDDLENLVRDFVLRAKIRREAIDRNEAQAPLERAEACERRDCGTDSYFELYLGA
jgi:hypothetical protein